MRARGWIKIPKLSNVATTTTTTPPAWSRDARARAGLYTRQYYNGTVMVSVCVCARARDSVSVTAGARSIGHAQYGLWTATERRLRRRWRRTTARPPPPTTARHAQSCDPPTGTRVDVARAGQWLSRDRPHPHTTTVQNSRRSRRNVCGVVLLLCVCFFYNIYFFSDFILLKHGRTSPSARAV